MSHIFGILLAAASIVASIALLNQSAALYMDLIALIMVVGGTTCVALMTFSINDLKEALKGFFNVKVDYSAMNSTAQLIKISQIAQGSPGRLAGTLNEPGLDPFLKDGIELIIAGFSADEIEKVLGERLFADRVREERSGSLMRGLSKYPPAFGLMGTVLGLVSVMRGMGEGWGPEETGLRMSVSLVATLYGLVLSNLVLLPAAEFITTRIKHRMAFKQILLEGILLLKERASPLLMQETLNSYLAPDQRRDLVGLKATGSGEKAA
jgi:chemotaxis protein MotA